MNLTFKLLNISLAVPLACFLPAPAHGASKPAQAKAPISALWSERADLTSLNLLYGSGGKEHAPAGKFTFVSEDKAGTAPKFEVTDEQGVKWKVKLGEEAQSETAATRLVWAAGYFVDEDYFVPELQVENMQKLDRGNQYVSAGGIIRNVRMERNVKGQKKTENWSWFKNDFTGTKELNGLRVMMALIGNWDLKEINNAIYDVPGEGTRYVVSDLGATFGKTGNSLTRSKNNPGDYSGTKFIQKVESDHVDFFLSSRPFALSIVNAPNYVTRTRMQEVAKNIPLADARWLGKILAPLSDEQIRDCFRAAGYLPDEVEGNAVMVRQRIIELGAL